jgi:hypothetical protein
MGAIKHLRLSERQRAELERGYREGQSHAVRQRCQMMLKKREAQFLGSSQHPRVL